MPSIFPAGITAIPTPPRFFASRRTASAGSNRTTASQSRDSVSIQHLTGTDAESNKPLRTGALSIMELVLFSCGVATPPPLCLLMQPPQQVLKLPIDVADGLSW